MPIESLDNIYEMFLRMFFKARYGFEDGIEKTLDEAGQTFGVTRERIRQIEPKDLRKLSHPTRTRKLKDFCSWQLGTAKPMAR